MVDLQSGTPTHFLFPSAQCPSCDKSKCKTDVGWCRWWRGPLWAFRSMLVDIYILSPLVPSSLVSLHLISPQLFPLLVSQVLIALGRFLKCNVFLYLSCIFILLFLLYFFFFNLHVILLMTPQDPFHRSPSSWDFISFPPFLSFSA